MYPQRPPLSLALLGILILASTSLIGCASSDATHQPVKPDRAMTKRGGGDSVQHDSPQAAYDAAKAATKVKDYSAFSDCLTPESKDMMAGAMIYLASLTKEIAAGPSAIDQTEKQEASCKVLDDVLAKYGVNAGMEDELKSIQAQAMDPHTSLEDMKAVLAKLTTPIKDKPAFLAEIMSAMDAIESAYTEEQGGMGENKVTGMFEGRLVNITVEGHRATAQVVVALFGEEKRAPIGFKMVNGGWLIELSDLAEFDRR